MGSKKANFLPVFLIASLLCFILKSREPLILILINIIHYVLKKPIQMVLTDGVRSPVPKKLWY